MGLVGWVKNTCEGVVLEVEGPRAELEKFLLGLESEKPARRFIQTRGEFAAALRRRILIHEKSIPVRDDVHAACEMFGLDPLLVAVEGDELPATGAKPAHIGQVREEPPPIVVLRSLMSANRVFDTPTGEQLPRIC